MCGDDLSNLSIDGFVKGFGVAFGIFCSGVGGFISGRLARSKFNVIERGIAVSLTCFGLFALFFINSFYLFGVGEACLE